MAVLVVDLVLRLVCGALSARRSCVLLFHLSVQRLDDLGATSSSAVDGLHLADQVFEKVAHVLLAGNDEVNVSIWQSEGDALPAVERNRVQLVFAESVEVLPEHPESGGKAAIDDTLDLFDVAGAAGLAFLVVFVLGIVNLFIRLLMQNTLLVDFCSSFRHGDWFVIQDRYGGLAVEVDAHLDDGLEAAEVLALFIQRGVVLEALDLRTRHVELDLPDFFHILILLVDPLLGKLVLLPMEIDHGFALVRVWRFHSNLGHIADTLQLRVHQNRVCRCITTGRTATHTYITRVLQCLAFVRRVVIAILRMMGESSRSLFLSILFFFLIIGLFPSFLFSIRRALVSYGFLDLLKTLQVPLREPRSVTLHAVDALNILLLGLVMISGAQRLPLTQHFILRRLEDRRRLPL